MRRIFVALSIASILGHQRAWAASPCPKRDPNCVHRSSRESSPEPTPPPPLPSEAAHLKRKIAETVSLLATRSPMANSIARIESQELLNFCTRGDVSLTKCEARALISKKTILTALERERKAKIDEERLALEKVKTEQRAWKLRLMERNGRRKP